VTSRLRALGVLGAVLLLIGVSMVGAAYAVTGLALSNEISCGSNCHSAYQNVQNASVLASFLQSIGIAVSVGGAALVLAAAVQFMDRWPRTVTVAAPPSPPRPILGDDFGKPRSSPATRFPP
jgi:cytosine/uracil/thiamine/allantoin permease